MWFGFERSLENSGVLHNMLKSWKDIKYMYFSWDNVSRIRFTYILWLDCLTERKKSYKVDMQKNVWRKLVKKGLRVQYATRSGWIESLWFVKRIFFGELMEKIL